jgi:fluoride ion exporter CrcB/FEX
VAQRAGRDFPFGTLVVNVLGAFALGIFVGATLGKDTYELAPGSSERSRRSARGRSKVIASARTAS